MLSTAGLQWELKDGHMSTETVGSSRVEATPVETTPPTEQPKKWRGGSSSGAHGGPSTACQC
eukprot:5069774-Amphidinium_carterae.1